MRGRRWSAGLAVASMVVFGACGTDETGDPAVPTAEASGGTPSTATPTDASTGASDAPADEQDAKVLAGGSFEPIGYEGQGEAAVVRAGGGLSVRLVDFDVEQGPALRVYLSAAPAGSPEQRYDDEFIDLGKLKSFEGDQAYGVPDGTSLRRWRSVVIWCAEFSVGFVVAPLGEGAAGN